jgi:hypothetical protein
LVSVTNGFKSQSGSTIRTSVEPDAAMLLSPRLTSAMLQVVIAEPIDTSLLE